tara:strand:+ start:5209 stop:6177 length:969 start_codon:yes stop_codon:yes gene_type:complete
MARNILVIGELEGSTLSSTSTELIAQATRLVDGGQVSVTLLGSGSNDVAANSFEVGADRVFTGDDPGYDQYNSDTWIAAVESAVEQSNPDAIFIAQSIVGRDMGPRIAARQGSAVAMDCINVEDDAGTLKATRPCYGGNALATYSFATNPAVVTIRAKAFDPIAVRSGATGESFDLGPPVDSRTTVIGRELAESEGLQITDAPIVVAGGRGLGAEDGFEMIEELASAFGSNRAAVGASRAACDLGWYPVSQQVGLTGKVVTPDLYVAVAISGASQHMAGCSGSKMIIAVNRDPEANIFAASKYGIVGDYKQVVPALIEALNA